MGGILGSLGIDPFYLFVILFVLQVAIIVLLCLVYDKYNRLQNSYNVFMKGKNGKSLEKSIFRRFEKLKKIIAEVLNVDEEEITADTTFVDDLGADSLDIFQIIMGLEEEFDIEIPNEEAEKIVTVGDAVEQIKNALNS